MDVLADLYVNGVRKKLRNYFAAWLPTEKLALGDIGVLKGNFFTRTGSLQDLGIPFKIRKDTAPAPLDYVSQSGVSVFLKAAGQTNPSLPSIPEAQAGVGIEFSQTGAFIIEATASYQPSIEDVIQLEKALLKAFEQKQWDQNWTVIVRLVQTPVATILISNSSNSKVEYTMSGNASSSAVDLGSASIQLGMASHHGDILKFPQSNNITPLFQLAQLKKKLFGPSFGIRAMRIRTGKTAAKMRNMTRPSGEELYFDLIGEKDLELHQE